jgi:murein DD-endopeptidase MepM/ murein hydrolase activator NlpD
VVVLFAAGVSASVAVSRGAADTTPTTTAAATTTTATTAPPTTTTTTSVTVPAPTTPPTTTRAPTTTAAATTSPPKSAAHPHARRPRRCGTVAVAGLVLPRRPLRAIGLPGTARRQRRLVFGARGSVVAIGSARLDRSRCRQGVLLRSLSLFRGAVTATSVAVSVARGGHVASSVRGLRVGGRSVPPSARAVRVGAWGVLTQRRHRAALELRLLRRHAGLPAGTTLLVAVAAARGAPASVSFHHPASHLRHRTGPRGPLKVTPPLGGKGYVFPVLGSPQFGDSYGASREDVSGGWHHGDDIFSPRGTPAVAVATGTLNRVGWEVIGGWRLWIRDRSGNGFYYAHLSGYAPRVLHAREVRAGEVIGFVGNTGDAFTTPPHLHFEIHPRQFIWRAYDGAVDPTSYLEWWRHVDRAAVPKPAVPSPPAGAPGHEARYVYGQLLAARGFRRHPPTLRPRIHLAARDRDAAPSPLAAAAVRHEARAAAGETSSSSDSLPLIALSGALALGIVAAAMREVRRRRDPGAGSA